MLYGLTAQRVAWRRAQGGSHAVHGALLGAEHALLGLQERGRRQVARRGAWHAAVHVAPAHRRRASP